MNSLNIEDWEGDLIMQITREVALSTVSYSRTDYTALRAYCLKLPIEKIGDLYYSEDDFPNAQFKTLEQFLIAMRQDLIERAIGNNPEFATILSGARQGGSITVKALDILIKAADAKQESPLPSHQIGRWLRKNTAKPFKEEKILTISDLMSLINQRGQGWWRSIPRIGQLRAKIIIGWLKQHETSLGKLHAPIYYEFTQGPIAHKRIVNLSITKSITPIEFATANSDLDGSLGTNRCLKFPYLQVKTDFDAVLAYLSKFQGQDHTYRSYRKEIERFVLWSLLVVKKPVSSLTPGDCLNYSRFLQAPSPAFIGTKKPRTSSLWRPFTSEAISTESQTRAIKLIKGLFNYLVSVRYLNSNPWFGESIKNKKSQRSELEIINYLSNDAYNSLISTIESASKDNAQLRSALPAILFMGDSGLLLSELTKLNRSHLKPIPGTSGAFIADVTGRAGKLREVVISPRAIHALRTHWIDIGISNFDTDQYTQNPLFCPLNTPQYLMEKSHKDIQQLPQVLCKGYTSDGLYKLIKKSIKTLIDANKFDPRYQESLKLITPHTFRHTFGMHAMASQMSLKAITQFMGISKMAVMTTYSNMTQDEDTKTRYELESMNFFNKTGS